MEHGHYQVTRSLILVPTRELSEQVFGHLKQLLAYCDKDVIVANVSSGSTSHLQRYVVKLDYFPIFIHDFYLEHCYRINLTL